MKNGIFLLVSVFALAFALAGCSEEKRYSSIYTTEPEAEVQQQSYDAPPEAAEVDLVEKLAQERREYVAALKTLMDYYEDTGNYRKSNWAKRELDMIGDTPQYKFIVAGEISSKQAKNLVSVPEADKLFNKANDLYNKTRFTVLIGDTPGFRKALNMFNELIENYPNSDKVDDAAYRAGQIYSFFKDYKLAGLYYKRAVQWNPDIDGYPVRFKLASILDKKLGRRSEALRYYELALKKEQDYPSNIETAEMRIKDIQRTRSSEQMKDKMKN
ncbi:tol-pal system protein YbgF [Sedimentisphaera cyanobacteriorum]|uniref:Tol-pal system protein YbgF n=1 Tax=Sedimentisphaera cyanobacteriorum TaxID=1940790 RepID=A0A1Q2HNE4_9BACT|nr:tetratricopeptide repeat protein [Sedimentisphaera cyanobacteriorum]AQQ08880.1 tol-pal system protein YbgF [Sedimentisphaera cyanobacteriorum]